MFLTALRINVLYIVVVLQIVKGHFVYLLSDMREDCIGRKFVASNIIFRLSYSLIACNVQQSH
jgi:hypothetical protein